jgi:hypothetical protein
MSTTIDTENLCASQWREPFRRGASQYQFAALGQNQKFAGCDHQHASAEMILAPAYVSGLQFNAA